MPSRHVLEGLAFAVAVLTAGGTASADEAEPKLALGGDILLVVPVGNLADGTGVLLGPLVRFGYRPLPALELTARTGYLFGFDKDLGQGITNRVSDFPLWIGGRYFFLDPDAGPYAGAEIGLNFLRSSGSIPASALAAIPGATAPTVAVVSAQDRARFGFDVSAGYVVSRKLPIDLRVQLNDFNLLGTDSGEKQLLGVACSAGYTYRF